VSDFAPSIWHAQAAGHKVVRQDYPEGVAGVKLSLETIADKIREGSLDKDVRGWAGDVLIAAGRPTAVRAKAQALLDAFRKATVYVSDPVNTEYIASAAATLCLRPGLCIRARDCDDGVVAYGSLLASVGIPVRVIKQRFSLQDQEHVLVEFQGDSGEWLSADPSTEYPIGRKAPAMEEFTVDPWAPSMAGLTGPPAQFVGIGKPGSSRVGLPPMRVGLGADLLADPTTLGDVLSYRRMWDDYVTGTLRAINACGDAYITVSSNPPAGYSAADLRALGDSYHKLVESYLALWNAYAGTKPADLLFQADDILTTFQSVVFGLGNLRGDPQFICKSKMPDPPTLDLQKQVIGQLEGAGLTTRGVLGLFAESVTGGLQVVARETGQAVGGAATALVQGAGKGLAITVPWYMWVGLGVTGIAVVWPMLKELKRNVP
jgi:hypothetical protein